MGAVFNRDYPFNRGWKPLPPTINYSPNDIELNVVSHERRRWPRASSLIGKETDERRTSKVEGPTSNNVFCQFKKILSKPACPNEGATEARSDSTLRNLSALEDSMV